MQVNITFSHADVETAGCFASSCNAQSADFLTTAAIHLEDAQGWLFDGVTVSHAGGYAVWINLGCTGNILVRQNLLACFPIEAVCAIVFVCV